MNFAKYAKIALISTVAIAMTTEAFAIDAAATRALNVRTGPGTGYSVIDTLSTGEIVNVAECDGAGWCYVDHDGAAGWVSASYLSQVDYGNTTTGWNRPGHRNPPQQPSPPPQPSTSDDVAGALAFAAILGIGALVIGSAIDQSNNPPQRNSPPPNWNGCQPGSAWHGPGSNCRPHWHK